MVAAGLPQPPPLHAQPFELAVVHTLHPDEFFKKKKKKIPTGSLSAKEFCSGLSPMWENHFCTYTRSISVTPVASGFVNRPSRCGSCFGLEENLCRAPGMHACEVF